jgi:hypothetical protein
MIGAIFSLLAALCVLGAAPGAAFAGDPGYASLFPQAQGAPVLDKSVSVALPAGKIGLTSVRFEPAPGLSQMFNTFWCGLVINSAGHAQGLVVIGEPGPTETLSCLGLQAAAAIDTLNGAPRIGLLYKANSPNAESIDAVVITFDKTSGAWKTDDAATRYLTEIAGTPSLAWMRQALGHGDGD